MYRINKKQPYDIQVFYNLLKSANEKNNFEKIKYNPYTYKDSVELNQLFVSFNNNILYDSVLVSHLLRSIDRGNNLLLIQKFPAPIMQHIFNTNDSVSRKSIGEMDTIMTYAKIKNSSTPTRFFYQYAKNTFRYSYTYFKIDSAQNSTAQNPIEILGTLSDTLPNFIKIPYGNGMVFIHCNPLFFTNYHMLRDSTFDYTRQMLAQIPPGNIKWMERPLLYNPSTTQLTQGPIHYLLSQPAFRNAWYMLIVLLIIALIFGAKRQQKIIPYVTPLKNRSLQYASTVATFYYNAGSHKYIANEMMKLFWLDLRERYKLHKSKDRATLFDPLSERSGLKKEHFVLLFRAEANVNYSNEQDSEYIMELHQLLDYYYKNRK